MKVNALKWAAIGCIGSALICLVAAWTGSPMPANMAECAMSGLFFGWLAAAIRNRGLR